jgi:predicted phosphodiesterase
MIMQDDAPRPVMTLHDYHVAAEALAQRLSTDVGAAALVRKLERIVRFEIDHGIPEDQRLSSPVLASKRGPPARRTALISDIHGNHAGLLAVLADIERQECDRILCLGDLVEGGPMNEEVVRTLRELGVHCVRGNHDETNDADLADATQQFLLGLPERIVENDVLYVHISPRARKRKINHPVEAWNVFDENTFRLIFIGHVHVPVIFGRRSTEYGDAALHAFEYNRAFRLKPGEQYIVRPGSIGYGRDNVGKIRYAIYDNPANTIELRAIDGPLLPLDHALVGTTVEFS